MFGGTADDRMPDLKDESNGEPDKKPVAIKPASRKLYSVKSKKNDRESNINTADILTVANMRSDDERTAEPEANGRSPDRQSNSSININSIEASPIQRISPNASNMSFQSNRKTRISSNLLSTQHSQSNTSSSASRFKPPNLFKD